ncbi:uncharacterized protein TNCV_129651 [Trichonephila clavipes]|nr:uncharacterized protein TNCV_129651 [Trichonephila clavipes]
MIQNYTVCPQSGPYRPSDHKHRLLYTRDGQRLARVPLMGRATIFWARHLSKRPIGIDSSTKEFSVRFSQFKELSETPKFILSPDVTSFDKLNMPQFDWLEIEEFDMQLIDF